MSLASEMRRLVNEIKISTKDRLQFVKDNQKDTQDLLARFNTELKEMARDLKEKAQKVRHFLDKSEKNRMEDFEKMEKDIQARIKTITADLKDFLAKSEETRAADFKATMSDIKAAIKNVRARTRVVQERAVDLLKKYVEDRKEAAGAWKSLKKSEEKAEEAAERIVKKERTIRKKAKKRRKRRKRRKNK